MIVRLLAGPKLDTPLTFSPVNVPKLVIFACAAVVTFPTKLPTNLLAPMLATLALPLTLNVPVTLAPVLVTTNTFAVPPTLVLTLLLMSTTTLLVPLTIAVPDDTDMLDKR